MYVCFIAAKDLAATRKQMIKKQQKKQPLVDSNNYVDPFESSEKGDLSPGTRHWSISGLKTRFSFRKTQSFAVPLRDSHDDTSVPRRRDRSKTASTFYDDENMSVTKNVSEPADFDPLELKGKNMNELLMLLKPVKFFCLD